MSVSPLLSRWSWYNPVLQSRHVSHAPFVGRLDSDLSWWSGGGIPGGRGVAVVAGATALSLRGTSSLQGQASPVGYCLFPGESECHAGTTFDDCSMQPGFRWTAQCRPCNELVPGITGAQVDAICNSPN